MKTFKEWLVANEMWFSPESSVQRNKRKPNKNLEGTALPKSLSARPAVSQGGTNPYPTAMKK